MDMKSRAVFLDRDGVINKVVFRDGRPASPRTFDEFRIIDGVAEEISRLWAAAYRLFVISNQPDIARGLLDRSVLEEMTKLLLASLPVERVLICVHDDADGCTCRKPKPGMLHKVAFKEGINLTESFVIGDSWKDVYAGNAAGCISILLRREYNLGVEADYMVESLAEAVNFILGGSNNGN
jgi:D-glycero-D-manno-heptose 1,7-bisphosphate phosphatase